MKESSSTLKRVGKCHSGQSRHRQGKLKFVLKNGINRLALCEIILHGDEESRAENIQLSGPMKIEVEIGPRVRAYDVNGIVEVQIWTRKQVVQ
jgi:hypothetical protein